jgi:hypothetical protein
MPVASSCAYHFKPGLFYTNWPIMLVPTIIPAPHTYTQTFERCCPNNLNTSTCTCRQSHSLQPSDPLILSSPAKRPNFSFCRRLPAFTPIVPTYFGASYRVGVRTCISCSTSLISITSWSAFGQCQSYSRGIGQRHTPTHAKASCMYANLFPCLLPFLYFPYVEDIVLSGRYAVEGRRV